MIDIEEEKFYDIPGHEGMYQITKTGIIRSLDRWQKHYKTPTGLFYRKGKILSPSKDTSGYPIIIIRNKEKRICYKIHRLLAIMFIPNPENKLQVNHKNGIKEDFRLENLEWCSPEENMQHAFRIGLKVARTGENCNFYKTSYMLGRKGASSHMSKLILDTQTGIFYIGVEEAASAKSIKSIHVLRQRLNGRKKNNTGLIYV